LNKKLALLVSFCVVAFLSFLGYLTFSSSPYRVKVCMSFKGRDACKTVRAKTEQDAVRNAVMNACADIAGGVTETVGCENTTPSSVTWLQKGP
jgi:hypothetical protein